MEEQIKAIEVQGLCEHCLSVSEACCLETWERGLFLVHSNHMNGFYSGGLLQYIYIYIFPQS